METYDYVVLEYNKWLYWVIVTEHSETVPWPYKLKKHSYITSYFIDWIQVDGKVDKDCPDIKLLIQNIDDKLLWTWNS